MRTRDGQLVVVCCAGQRRAVGDVLVGCVWTKNLSRFCFMFSVENDYTPVRLEATPNSTKTREIRVSQSQNKLRCRFLLSTLLQFCFRFVVQPTVVVAFHFLTRFRKKSLFFSPPPQPDWRFGSVYIAQPGIRQREARLSLSRS